MRLHPRWWLICAHSWTASGPCCGVCRGRGSRTGLGPRRPAPGARRPAPAPGLGDANSESPLSVLNVERGLIGPILERFDLRKRGLSTIDFEGAAQAALVGRVA